MILQKIIVLRQDEVQGFHWNNLQCTLHPVVVYYQEMDMLKSVSYCIIYDNKHDIGMVYEVQRKIIEDLKLRFPQMNMLHIFPMAVQGSIKTAKTCTIYAIISQIMT